MRALWETVVVYSAIAVATGIALGTLIGGAIVRLPAATHAQRAADGCWSTEDHTTIYARYTCRYTLQDYAGIDEVSSRVGRHFTYAHWRRSDNVEDHRSDIEIVSDDLSISEFRAALNKHTPTPTIMTVSK